MSESGPKVMARVLRHMSLFRETVVFWQALTSLGWLLSGICAVPVVQLLRISSDWTIVPLILALFAARSSGMCWNRLIDGAIDAQNPRTAKRALPSGRILPRELAGYALLTLAAFLLLCFSFPKVGRLVAIGVAIAIIGYSFLKRFTACCHFALGAIHGCIPMVGSFWQSGEVSWPSVALGIAAFSSISGTDILYAIQDEKVDERLGLRSIPVTCGRNKAVCIALILHCIAFFSIVTAFWLVGVSIVGYMIFSGACAFFVEGWKRVWENPSEEFPKMFPAAISSFSLVSLLVFLVDRAWREWS
jgi:4-hydroxybenzoate polyprenyltransferase